MRRGCGFPENKSSVELLQTKLCVCLAKGSGCLAVTPVQGLCAPTSLSSSKIYCSVLAIPKGRHRIYSPPRNSMQSPSRDQEVHSDRVMGGPQPRLSVVQPGDPPGSPPAHVSSSPPLPTVGYVTTALGSLLNDPRPLVSPIVATHLQTVVCYNPPCSKRITLFRSAL